MSRVRTERLRRDPDRDRDRRSWLRGAAPPPIWVRVLPVALLGVVCAATLSSREPLDIGFLLGAIPPLAVLSYGPAATAILGALVIGLFHVPALQLNRPGNSDLLTLIFVAVLSVVVAFVRSHRDAQLVTVRTVAEAAQRAVVPPLPERVGPVRCTGLYRAAQRGTLVGGDFFDVRDGPYGVRAVMGDVQGHGLSAVATVASLLGAFRESVLDQRDLESVAAHLDRRLVVDSAAVQHAELFATGMLLEFSADAHTVRIVACGHPPPLLMRDGHATELAVAPGLPFGLGLGGGPPAEELSVELRPGDRLFLASDGVLEARDESGAFYPLVDRIASLDDGDPATLTEHIWADLVRHCGVIRDDATMLVLTPDHAGPADLTNGH